MLLSKKISLLRYNLIDCTDNDFYKNNYQNDFIGNIPILFFTYPFLPIIKEEPKKYLQLINRYSFWLIVLH